MDNTMLKKATLNTLLQEIPRTSEDYSKSKWNFWNKQPVLKKNQFIKGDTVIEYEKPSEQKQLPDGFMWSTVTIDEEVANFLSDHNRENYLSSIKRIWTVNELNRVCGDNPIISAVRVSKTGKLVGIGIFVPMNVQINRSCQNVLVPYAVCVYPKLRFRNMLTIIVNEAIRKAPVDINIGLFASNRWSPTPFYESRIMRRGINIKRMIDSGFTRLPDNVSLEDIEDKLDIYDEIPENMIRMSSDHINDVFRVYKQYMDGVNVYRKLGLTDIERMCNLQDDNYQIWVIVDSDGNVQDFIETSIIYCKCGGNVDKLKMMNIGVYTSNINTSYKILRDTLKIAKHSNIDVVNSYEMGEGEAIMSDLSFEDGGIQINYGLYGYAIRAIKHTQIMLPIWII